MAMTDLDDLNRTLYDIGAQDLLDVWEAMEATDDCIGQWNPALSNGLAEASGCLTSTPVLKDRLLTDSMMLQGIASSAQTGCGGGGSAGSSTAPSTDTDFPVNAEHS